MKVLFTPQFKLSDYTAQKQEVLKHKDKENTNYSYNPIAYRDYNISFGARLCRSPENFYEQDFNEKNMPKTLHDYIYTGWDTDFKRTIPPAQAMKEVFGNIALAKDLDMVKRMYPNEPLFADLSAEPKVKSREGLLGAINLFKDDPAYQDKTLFKNGKNDFGMYILNKIYIEGKTLEEINNDFKKDVSVYYEGFDIKPKDYMAYGIKFPHRSFWHSFLPTREDRNFKYVRIPRSLTERQEAQKKAAKAHGGSNETRVRKPKFEHVKEWEVDKIAKLVTESNGNKSDIAKKLRKTPSESNNFVAKYMSEIMSVTMERLHMSPEMKIFFNRYEEISDSQRAKLKKYWTTPDVKENMSYVMKSTIQMFMEAYDEDGENEVFQDLLDYAHNIKPTREAEEELHNLKQLEYEQMFAELDKLAESKPVEEVPAEKDAEDVMFDNLKAQAEQNGVSVYELSLPDGASALLTYNREELCRDVVEDAYGIFPTVFKDKMYKFMVTSPRVSDEYLISVMIKNKGVNKFVPRDSLGNIDDPVAAERLVQMVSEQLMSTEEMNNTARQLGIEFEKNNKRLMANTKAVMLELVSKIPFESEDYRELILAKSKDKLLKIKDPEERLMASFNIIKNIEYAGRTFRSGLVSRMTMTDIMNTLRDAGITELPGDLQKFIDERMEYYSTPLTNKEIKLLSSTVPSKIYRYDVRKSDVLKEPSIALVWEAAIINIKNNPKIRKDFMSILKQRYFVPDQTLMRGFLEKEPDKNLESVLIQKIITELFENNVEFIKEAAAHNLAILKLKLGSVDYKLYNNLLNYHHYSVQKYGE